jgi:hypothetical protein
MGSKRPPLFCTDSMNHEDKIAWGEGRIPELGTPEKFTDDLLPRFSGVVLNKFS